MIPDEAKRELRKTTAALVATMRGSGFDDEAIRKLSAQAAALTVANGIDDAWDQEAYAEEFRIAFEQAVKHSTKPRGDHAPTRHPRLRTQSPPRLRAADPRSCYVLLAGPRSTWPSNRQCRRLLRQRHRLGNDGMVNLTALWTRAGSPPDKSPGAADAYVSIEDRGAEGVWADDETAVWYAVALDERITVDDALDLTC